MIKNSKKVVLFVYGTLKKNQCRQGVLNDQKFFGEAKTAPNYTLYNCGAYPALVNTGTTSISGELYEVDEKCLDRLDRIEGSPFLYKKEKVTLESHPDLDCQTYIYQQNCRKLKDCGDSWDDSMADY